MVTTLAEILPHAARTHAEQIALVYGIAKTGPVVNPLSSMLTPDEVRYSVIDAGALAVLASSDKAGTLLPRRQSHRRCVLGRRTHRGRDAAELITQPADMPSM